MRRTRRDWLTGLGTVTVLAVAYLLATPTGRAVQLAVRGVPVGTPQTVVEAWIGSECDDGVNLFRSVLPNFRGCDAEGRRQLFEQARAEMEAGTSAHTEYWGPLFAVKFDFVGRETSRFVRARVVPHFRVMGVVNLVGILLLGVGAGMSSWLSRRVARPRG